MNYEKSKVLACKKTLKQNSEKLMKLASAH